MQTIRNISRKSSNLLESFSNQLPLETRAIQVLDESKLEKAFATNDAGQLNLILNENPVGYSVSTKSEIKQSFERNRKLVKSLHELYNGRCQVTGHDSPLLYGVPTAEAHHVVYRSRGGADEMENLVLVSPNLHTAIHSANATFDYSSLAFVFPNGRVEPLVLNTHLEKRVV
jgi:5-methylcytosine-specific restriction protein A